jgi:hypothetical protein
VQRRDTSEVGTLTLYHDGTQACTLVEPFLGIDFKTLTLSLMRCDTGEMCTRSDDLPPEVKQELRGVSWGPVSVQAGPEDCVLAGATVTLEDGCTADGRGEPTCFKDE